MAVEEMEGGEWQMRKWRGRGGCGGDGDGGGSGR